MSVGAAKDKPARPAEEKPRAIGGVVTGPLGKRAYAMGCSAVTALPVFQDAIVLIAIGIASAIVVSAAVALIVGFDEKAA